MKKVLPMFEVWLWIAISSSIQDSNNAEETKGQKNGDVMCNDTIKCNSTVIFMCIDQMYIPCEAKKDMEWTCTRSSIVLNCVSTSTDYDYTTSSTKCDCETACGNEHKPLKGTKEETDPVTPFPASRATPDTTVTSSSTNSKAKTPPCPKSTTVTVLGALVGLLVVLLAIVSSSLLWTCWIMRMKREMKITSEQLSGDQLVNPTYEGDDILSLQPRAPMPAYETIPLHPKDGATLELLEQGNNGYSVLSRKQNTNTPESTVKMVTIHEDNNEKNYSKLELTVNHNNIAENSQDGDYSKLETLNIESDTKDITSEDVREEARNESDKEYEITADNSKVNSEEGAHEMENHDSNSETDKKEDKIQPLVARASDTQNVRNEPKTQETNQLMNELVVVISPQGDS